MKWFWILVLVAGAICALATDEVQGVLHNDPMDGAHERATEIDELLAPPAAD